MIDFPASPTLGQQFTAAGVTWVWDGTKWTPAGASSAVAQAMNDNRIINGDMRIDQRNNGASGTAISSYMVDRWGYIGSVAGKGTWGQNFNAIGPRPPGFVYYLGFQSSSAYTLAAGDAWVFLQQIEADMVSDFMWGTASAQSVTLSFWVYSSLTGTFGGVIRNYAATRAYPFIYSIPTANIWTRIVITIPGDTSGSWVLSGSGGSITLVFDLGSGSTTRAPANAWIGGAYNSANGTVSVVSTNAATFYVTGVKLEIGSIATPFNRQSLAKSLADCQRYYYLSSGTYPSQTWFNGQVTSGSPYYAMLQFPVPMRAVPATITFTNAVNNLFSTTVGSINGADTYGVQEVRTASATGPSGYYGSIVSASAEL